MVQGATFRAGQAVAGITGALYYTVEDPATAALQSARVRQAASANAARSALRRFSGRDLVELSELALFLAETQGEAAVDARYQEAFVGLDELYRGRLRRVA